MRIALVYDGVYPYSVGGGEKIFHDLARHLAPRHEVFLLGLHLWDGPAEMDVAPNVRLIGICRPAARNTLQAGDARSLKQALRFAAWTFRALKRLGHLDLIDCMATPYFPLYAAYWRARLDRVPLASTWLELWSLADWRAYVGSGPKARLAWQIEHFATKLPRHIISISPQTSEALAGRDVSSDRLSTITPWADIAAIDAIAPDDHPCDLLFAGRLIQSKGVHLLIEALALLREAMPGVRCRIVGDGPERARLETRVHELGLGGNMLFSGFLDSHAAVVAAMKASRVFVLPSSREGFGIVVVEAAACGVPCVTIDAPNNAARNLVRAAGAGAVCGAEPAALSEALLAQLRLGDHERAGASARVRAWAKDYDWPARASAYEEIYDRIARDG